MNLHFCTLSKGVYYMSLLCTQRSLLCVHNESVYIHTPSRKTAKVQIIHAVWRLAIEIIAQIGEIWLNNEYTSVEEWRIPS